MWVRRHGNSARSSGTSSPFAKRMVLTWDRCLQRHSVHFVYSRAVSSVVSSITNPHPPSAQVSLQCSMQGRRGFDGSSGISGWEVPSTYLVADYSLSRTKHDAGVAAALWRGMLGTTPFFLSLQFVQVKKYEARESWGRAMTDED